MSITDYHTFRSLFTHSCDIHIYKNRQSVYIRAPFCRLITCARSILHRGPVVWNALQDKIKLDDSLKSFSKNVINNLLNNGGTYT